MGNLNYFVYNGKSCAEFGVYAASMNQFDFPERIIETVEIPGRNGDVAIDGGRFSNIKLSYAVFIPKDVRVYLPGLAAFLSSEPGYHRLEDTFCTDVYRMARFTGGIKGSASDRVGGSVEIVFDAKPQRFLLEGEETLTFTAAGAIWNPTDYEALPLIRAYGQSGSVTVNGTTITFSGLSSYVDIDCDLQDCYEGSNNRNGNAVFTGISFPGLSPGENAISFTGFSRIEITPRFWTI